PHPALQKRSEAWRLRKAVHLVKTAEDWMFIRKIDDVPIGEDAFQLAFEVGELDWTVEVVEGHRAAAKQEFPKDLDLTVLGNPGARLDEIDPRMGPQKWILDGDLDGIVDLNCGDGSHA